MSGMLVFLEVIVGMIPLLINYQGFKEAELLESLLVELEQRGYKRENIVLFGFSQGCLMSLELAIRSKRESH